MNNNTITYSEWMDSQETALFFHEKLYNYYLDKETDREERIEEIKKR